MWNQLVLSVLGLTFIASEFIVNLNKTVTNLISILYTTLTVMVKQIQNYRKIFSTIAA